MISLYFICREIVRWTDANENECEEAMKKIALTYKTPDAALDFSNQANSCTPDQLEANNYVKEMHNFLYREEEARTSRLTG